MVEDRFGTPMFLTDALQAHFGRFDLDLAAEPWSAVCDALITKEQDLFKQRMMHLGHGYLNPPYSKGSLARFVSYARERVVACDWYAVTLLVPAYSGEGWFQCIGDPVGKVLKTEYRYRQIAHPKLARWTRYMSEGLVTDIIPIAGRITFRFPPGYRGARESARFSSVVVRFTHPEAA